jgi:hypothetical protein
VLALALNDFAVLIQVYERIPRESIVTVVASIGRALLPAFLHFLAALLNPVLGTRHFALHLEWTAAALDTHLLTIQDLGVEAKEGALPSLVAAGAAPDLRTTLLHLLQEVQRSSRPLGKLCRRNEMTLRYLADASRVAARGPEDDADAKGEEEGPLAGLEETLGLSEVLRSPDFGGQQEPPDLGLEAVNGETRAPMEKLRKKARKKRPQDDTAGAAAPAESTATNGANGSTARPLKKRKGAAAADAAAQPAVEPNGSIKASLKKGRHAPEAPLKKKKKKIT